MLGDFVRLWVFLALVLLAASSFGGADAASPSRPAVLVELFTSEGCSSCPPADDLLARLDSAPPPGVDVIALGEHVDYWNHLGWADPFSDSRFSARQTSYARSFGLEGPYTPQMIVDGARQFTGSRSGEAYAAIAEAAEHRKGTVALKPIVDAQGKMGLSVRIDDLPHGNDVAEVIVAVTENGLRSNIERGENAGRALQHAAVVRTWIVAGAAADGRFSGEVLLPLSSEWARDSLRAVVFAQESDSRRVVAAGSVKL